MYRTLKSEVKASQREGFEVEELITHQVYSAMIKMKISILVTLLYTGALYAGGGDFSINPEVQINENGKITMSRYLGEIMVGDDVLPIVMNFRSDMVPSPTSLVPKHEIPLLEAKAVTINENSSRVLLPNGNTLYLRRKSPKHAYETDPPWGVKLDGSRLVISDGKNKFTYNKGRIASWKINTDSGVRWIYGESGLTSLNRYSGGEILSVDKTLQALKLDCGNRAAAVQWEFEQLGEGADIRWVPLMKSYSSLDGGVMTVGSAIKSASVIETVKGGRGNNQTSFGYNYLSGDAVELNGDKVEVKFVKGFEKPSVIVLNEGGVKYLHTASSYGPVIEKELLKDGSVINKSYLLTSSGRKLRKVVLKNGGQEHALYKAYYGSKGNGTKLSGIARSFAFPFRPWLH